MKNKLTSNIIHVTGASIFAIAALGALTAGPAVASTVYVVSALVAWTLAAMVAYELRPSISEENSLPAVHTDKMVRLPAAVRPAA